MKFRVSSHRFVRVLMLLAAVAVLDDFLGWRSTQDYFVSLPLSRTPITASVLSAKAGEDRTDPFRAFSLPTTTDPGPGINVDANNTEKSLDIPLIDTALDIPLNDTALDIPLNDTAPDIPLTDTAPDIPLTDTAEAPFDWRTHVTARLSVVDSRIALAQVGTAKVRHDVVSQRKIELVELKLQIATRNRERFVKGESQRERASLKNQLQLAQERHRQLEERLTWSESLANGGLISQTALEIDVSAVNGSKSELRVAEDRLTVFETIDLERYQTKLDADVVSARAEFEFLQLDATSGSKELESNYVTAKLDLESAQTYVAELNHAWPDDSGPVDISPRVFSGLTKDVELARSAMLRAEQELVATKKQVDAAALNSRQLQKVQELQLEAFLKARHSETLHELSSKIRVISEGLAADEQQLSWAHRVVRKGYITATELRSAELAVNKRKAELANLLQQKNILSEHTLKRDKFELTAKLRHASNELVRQKRLAGARIAEVKIIANAKRQAWEILRQNLEKADSRQPVGPAELEGG